MKPSEQNRWKKTAAEAAVKLVEDGTVVGLGTGSTAAFFVAALARRIAEERLRIVAIPTSAQTAKLARSLKIPAVVGVQIILRGVKRLQSGPSETLQDIQGAAHVKRAV
jgi:ribose 5-phosphate isomerase